MVKVEIGVAVVVVVVGATAAIIVAAIVHEEGCDWGGCESRTHWRLMGADTRSVSARWWFTWSAAASTAAARRTRTAATAAAAANSAPALVVSSTATVAWCARWTCSTARHRLLVHGQPCAAANARALH